MALDVVGDHALIHRLGAGTTRRERLVQRPRNTGDLPHRGGVRALGHRGELDAQPFGQQLLQSRVVDPAGGDGVLVQCSTVDGLPLPDSTSFTPRRGVSNPDLVGHQNVGMQVRVPATGFEVSELCCDHPVGFHLLDASGADAVEATDRLGGGVLQAVDPTDDLPTIGGCSAVVGVGEMRATNTQGQFAALGLGRAAIM
ncbi:hypothetical protein QR98_0086910, partial [Sarcoptes scabiei]